MLAPNVKAFPLIPDQFLSAEWNARIEPADFLTHVLAQYDVEPADLAVRPVVLLTFIPALQHRLLRHLGTPPPQPQPMMRQPWYNPEGRAFSVMPSPIGAPVAVMLLEQLIALGARRFLYLGFCGALEPTLAIGDLFIPQQAIREEGTSYHYLPAGVEPLAAAAMTDLLKEEGERQGVQTRQGRLWTTDAPYRETAEKIAGFRAAGVQAVDMEVAALLAVAAFRGCEVAALLVVSDECYHPTWRPGFGAPALRRGCQEAVALGAAVGDLLGS